MKENTNHAVKAGAGSSLRVITLTVLSLMLAVGAVNAANAQSPNDRKVLVKVQPKYPEYLKIHEIGGVVKLMVEITPKGTVKNVTPVGGNPILVDAAIEAVKQWKYAPADDSNTQEVKIDFVPKQ